MIRLAVKTELYQRYADDIDIALRSIGREVKFCPVDGCWLKKSVTEIENEADVGEDKITIRELKKIADTLMVNLETEQDSLSNHPELGAKVPVLDLVIWVKKVQISASRM